ncbi:hypothetical protein [Kordiimonas pumila]|uniref:STAS/SEC14 domain-containing protein n=1 Tax=Kordiimonas pumila TaxID=2161677 RepID=A0ABV7D473_9PROT|nr:hypothetical protein [Kordiimonas pumila]
MSAYSQIQNVKSIFALSELKTFRMPGGMTYAVVAHNADTGLVCDIWFGDFHTSEQFREVLYFVLEQMQTGAYKYWLADLRFMSSSFLAANDWMVGELMPAIFEAGLVREAVVLPEKIVQAPEGFDVFGAASTVLKNLADGRVRGFTSMKAAKQWLLEGILENF